MNNSPRRPGYSHTALPRPGAKSTKTEKSAAASADDRASAAVDILPERSGHGTNSRNADLWDVV